MKNKLIARVLFSQYFREAFFTMIHHSINGTIKRPTLLMQFLMQSITVKLRSFGGYLPDDHLLDWIFSISLLRFLPEKKRKKEVILICLMIQL